MLALGRRPLATLLSLFRQLLRLLAQFVLITRQAFELPLELRRGQARLVPGQLALLLRQRFLPAGQLANARERILVLLRLVGARLAGGRRFVVGLLPLAKLLLKQGGQVERLSVAIATATSGLLHGHLATTNLGLRLQEMSERRFFERQRLGRTEAIEFGDRLPHGPDGLGHGILGVGPRQPGLRAPPAPLRKRRGRHLGGNLFGLVPHA